MNCRLVDLYQGSNGSLKDYTIYFYKRVRWTVKEIYSRPSVSKLQWTGKELYGRPSESKHPTLLFLGVNLNLIVPCRYHVIFYYKTIIKATISEKNLPLVEGQKPHTLANHTSLT